MTFAAQETRGRPEAEVCSDHVVQTIATMAGPKDLIVLGLPLQRGHRSLGRVAVQIAARTEAATLMISHEA
ncbi:MAG: hypothetical protein KF729_07780 [Sandaracinaceae bacterium]|nr:hypothetical protein [Sandaracinaceae bacterium]